MHAANSSVHVLFHTNRPLQPFYTSIEFQRHREGDAEFAWRAGWWGDRATRDLGATYKVTGRYRSPKKVAKKLKAKWNLPQSLKFEWSLSASRDLAGVASSSSSTPYILADTDTVFQCTPSEIRRVFDSFHSPLVIGTEHWLFPRPDGARGMLDPFETVCGAPGESLRNPNSGLVS